MEDNKQTALEEKAEEEDLNKKLERQLDIGDVLLMRQANIGAEGAATGAHGKTLYNEYAVGEDEDEDEDEDLESRIGESELKRSETIAKVYTNKSTGAIDLPPDGGYGWVCCICVFMIQLSVWGPNSGYGVLLQYYLSNDVFPGGNATKFAWNAGLIICNAQLFASISLIAVKMIGFRLTMTIAMVFHCVSYVLQSFATQLWQLFLCQGVMLGVSYSFLFVPANSIIPQWFLKKRALAVGICMSGTGCGGVLYTLAISTMIQKYGNQKWALRMVAIVTFVTLSTSIFFLRTRKPEVREEISWKNLKLNIKLMFNKQVLTAKRFWYLIIWVDFAILGYTILLFSFSTYATSIGLSVHQATILTALLNSAQTIGRPAMGQISDKYTGRINFSIALEFILVILVFGFWMNARTFLSLIFCALMLGSALGVGNVMNAVLIADSFTPEQFGSAWSILNSQIGLFTIFSEVMALNLRDYTKRNPFEYAQIFSGLIFVVAGLSLIPFREETVRRLLVKRRDHLAQEISESENSINLEKNGVDIEMLAVKQDVYNELLEGNVKGWLKRAFYPIKV